MLGCEAAAGVENSRDAVVTARTESHTAAAAARVAGSLLHLPAHKLGRHQRRAITRLKKPVLQQLARDTAPWLPRLHIELPLHLKLECLVVRILGA